MKLLRFHYSLFAIRYFLRPFAIRNSLLAFAVLILVLPTLACGLGTRESADKGQPPTQAAGQSPPQATAAPSGGQDEPAVATQAAAAPSQATQVSAAGEGEEAPLDLVTSLSGLENLNSYRAAFRFDWSGIKDGQPVTGFMEMRSAFVREPPAQELHFSGQGLSQGEGRDPGEVAFIQVGDTAWFHASESDSWMQVPAGSMDFSEGLFFKPEDILKDFDVSKARRSPLPQNVNGVETYQYTFDEADFDLAALPQGEEVKNAEGEVYVAVDGDYVVRLVLSADLTFAASGEMFDEGNVTMTFDISDVNQPIVIQPPAEAATQAGGREDLPMLPDAQIQFSSADFITYQTPSSIRDAAQFYEDEMPNHGWTAKEGNMVLDESAILGYNKAGETASVVIGTDQGKTSVMISITKE